MTSRFNCCAGREILLGAGIFFLAAFGVAAQPSAGSCQISCEPGGMAAVSVQTLLGSASDASLVPLFVASSAPVSAQGGTISRTNDWFYYRAPASDPATDSFAYIITNLNGLAATGMVTVVESNFVATNFIAISALASNRWQLQFHGQNGSYFIQSSSNLLQWTNAGARLAWPTNFFSFTDQPPADLRRQFYRAATGASAPEITNYEASGSNNVQVDFQLGLEGGDTSPYPATILSQPAFGYLFQDDGTVISQVPAVVTGIHGGLHFLATANQGSPPTASFQYKITRPSDGLDSLPQTFEIHLAVDAPTITSTEFTLRENTGSLIQVTATDPDLRYPTNRILGFEVVFSTSVGNLYQVDQSGDPLISQPIVDGTGVLNTNGLLYYVPPDFQWGNPFETFVLQATNQFGVVSPLTTAVLNVSFVNSPPIAEGGAVSGYSDDPAIEITLGASDPDNNLATVYFPNPPTNGQLRIYSLAPGQGMLVTATNNRFPWNEQAANLNFLNASKAANPNECIPDFTDTNAPYTTFSYVVTDAAGATASNTITININERGLPFPFPATPASYTGLMNSTNIPTPIFATNLDGTLFTDDGGIFTLSALPTHGTLYYSHIAITSAPTTLPPHSFGTNSPLYYVPNSGYYSSADGADSFSYLVGNNLDSDSCANTVGLIVVGAPALGSVVSTPVYLDENGNTTTPGVFKTSLQPFDAHSNAIMSITVGATPAGTAPYGYLQLVSSNDIVNIQSNGPASLQFEGTASALNAALTAGVRYYATATSAGALVGFTLNDLGATGFGTNSTVTAGLVIYNTGVIGPNATKRLAGKATP